MPFATQRVRCSLVSPLGWCAPRPCLHRQVPGGVTSPQCPLRGVLPERQGDTRPSWRRGKPHLEKCFGTALAASDLLAWRHRRMEKAEDWRRGNRGVSVMQQGRDLTDLCWHFVFISHVVTDELHNKIPTDCRGCKKWPFFVRGRKYKQKSEGEKSYLSAPHLSSVFGTRSERKNLSIAPCCAGSPWRRGKVTGTARAIQHFGASGSFSVCRFVRTAGDERGGGVRGELSHISSKLLGPQLASTSCIMAGFKLGNSFGIPLLMLSSDSSGLAGTFLRKIQFVCVQAGVRGGGVTAVLEKSSQPTS